MNSCRAVSRLVTIVCLAVTGAIAQAPGAWSFPDFSARQVFQAGNEEVSYKVYLAGSRVRVETEPGLAILYDPMNDLVYRLTASAKGHPGCTAMTMTQSQMLPSPLALLFGMKVKRTPAGTATVEGHECDVEDVETTMVDGKRIQSRVWEAKDLKGVPVKIESQLPTFKLTTFYRDIVVGPPDAALVTPPSDCIPAGKVSAEAAEPRTK